MDLRLVGHIARRLVPRTDVEFSTKARWGDFRSASDPPLNRSGYQSWHIARSNCPGCCLSGQAIHPSAVLDSDINARGTSRVTEPRTAVGPHFKLRLLGGQCLEG